MLTLIIRTLPQKGRNPFDYYEFGVELVSPLVDLEASFILRPRLSFR